MQRQFKSIVRLIGDKGRLIEYGFRYVMSTVLYEKGYNSAWIETQFAHIDKKTIRGTYNHAQSQYYMDAWKWCSGMRITWMN